MPATPLPYADEIETVPPDEAADIDRTVEITREILAQRGVPQRDVHVKTHGAANAEFHVLPVLPVEYAQGLMAQAGTFPAFVRFSNSAPQSNPDAVPDARGLAIKVRNATGEFLSDANGEQDFILVNHPAFIARDVRDYLRLEESRLQLLRRPLSAVQNIVTGGEWNPLHWHWRELLNVAQVGLQPPSHPASYTYFSMTPFRYGEFVAKFRVQPVSALTETTLQWAGRIVSQPDGMRQALTDTLARQELAFNFQVQLRTNVELMPIEDATVIWPEHESPFVTVARLTIPPQDITAPELQERGERTSFSVWHALAAHRPLGGINRSRRPVYEASAAWRHATVMPRSPNA